MPAFPMIAGAGTMTSLISLRAEYTCQYFGSHILNILVKWIVLKLTSLLNALLAQPESLLKVFGIILLAIAIKLFSSNVSALFNLYD